MSFKNMEWFGDIILDKTNRVVAKTSKDVAKLVNKDAIKILKRNSNRVWGTKKKAYGNSPKGLTDQFTVRKSKFKTGGYLAYCQGPLKWIKPYHASFVEMGTYKDMAQPFMRPAARKNKRKANKMYQNDLNAWLKTG